MRRAASSLVCLGLLIQACASPQEGQSLQRSAGSVSLIQFSSNSTSQVLEQGYRFVAQVSGQPRSDQGWQSQVSFVREFSEGTDIAEVIRSVQVGLREEFVYEPSGFQFASSPPKSGWSMNFALGNEIVVHDVQFQPVRSNQKGEVQVGRIEWLTSSAKGADQEALLPITPVRVASIMSWDPALEQQRDWQAGRGIDPWLIPEREYVDRRRKNAGFAAFLQFGVWVLSGHSRS